MLLQGKYFFPVLLPIWKFPNGSQSITDTPQPALGNSPLSCHLWSLALSHKQNPSSSMTLPTRSWLIYFPSLPCLECQMSPPLSTAQLLSEEEAAASCPSNTERGQTHPPCSCFHALQRAPAAQYNRQHFSSELSVTHRLKQGKSRTVVNRRNNWRGTWVLFWDNLFV